MEPLWGCLAVVLVLVAFVAPVVALVLAIRLHVQIGRLRAEIADLRAGGATPPSRAPRTEAAGGAEAPTRAAPVAHIGPASAASGRPDPAVATPGIGAVAAEAADPAAAPASGEPPASGLEERLGARLPIWLGGIALALAGAFLVKYSVDQGWLSPTVRVALGLLFGVALLAAGELLRERSFRVSQALSAAGVADLYAVLLAGIRLYELIPPLVGFALMAANTAVAVLLSLRQGAIVAMLGLVGGFATPALVDLGRREPFGLFLYLLLLDLGLLVITRRRRWPGLALAALVASMAWAGIWIADVARSGGGLPVGLFLIASAALFAGAGAGVRILGPVGRPASALGRWLAATALGSGLLLLAGLVDASGYGALEWGLFALLAAGVLVLARLREDELFALAPFAAAVTAALLAVRSRELADAEACRDYLLALVALAAIHALGAWALSFRARSPGRWSVLSSAVLIAYPLLGYFSVRDRVELPWAWLSLAAATLAIALLAPYARRRGEIAEAEVALASFAVAATLFASLALPLALDRAWLSVAFALEVPLLLALRERLEIPALGRLAQAAAGIAAVRLLANPEVLAYPVSARPLFNAYLGAYLAAAAAFAAAAALSRRRGAQRTADVFDAGTAAFLFALATLEIWHFFDRSGPIEPFRRWALLEWGTQAAAWGLLGLAGIELGRRLGRRAFSIAGRLAVALCGLQALAVHGLLENPAWERNPVGGTPLADLLLLAFAAPAALLLVAARRVERLGGRRLPPAARAAATVLLFGYGTLEVRHLFRGSDLTAGVASNAEQFSYSAFAALFGMALLAAGIRKGSKPLRFAALAVMLLAVVKVFLFDTSELEGLFRVFSFLGLGASLLVLAHLYQRFLLRREAS